MRYLEVRYLVHYQFTVLVPAVIDGGEAPDLSFYVHGEAVAASSKPSITAGKSSSYESTDSYKPTKKIRYTLDLDR